MKRAGISALELAGIVVLAIVVLVLGVLQYRSTSEIGREEQSRLKTSLTSGVRGFDQDFAYEFERLCEAFELDPEGTEGTVEQRITKLYEGWVQDAAEPGLVQGVQLWKTGGDQGFLVESLFPPGKNSRESSTGSKNDALAGFVEAQSKSLPATVSGRDAVYYPWFFVAGGPALVRPAFEMSVPNNVDMEVQPVGFLAIRLDRQFLEQRYFPDLVRRHFGGTGFAVAIRNSQLPFQSIYMSTTDFPVATASPDAIVNLVSTVAEEAKRTGHPPVQPDDEASQWQLVVQHSAGSLDAAVSTWKTRNLATSLGLLALLAVSMGLLLSLMRRAQKLAKLQMEFVAGVSHELCTPLSVINCAAENLADGVVDNPKEIREYAEIIHDQGRRLEHLVEQSLSVAAGKLGESRLFLRPLQISTVVMRTVEASGPMLREAEFEVDEKVGSDLPLVVADPYAIEKCMENLLSNAVKYAGARRKITVSTKFVTGTKRPEVQVSVEDKGMGIPAGELSNLFEPFYRVPSVREARIRGAGLGLYLVKKMMEEMGGTVTVASEVGRGSAFVLHFPAMQTEAQSG